MADPDPWPYRPGVGPLHLHCPFADRSLGGRHLRRFAEGFLLRAGSPATKAYRSRNPGDPHEGNGSAQPQFFTRGGRRGRTACSPSRGAVFGLGGAGALVGMAHRPFIGCADRRGALAVDIGALAGRGRPSPPRDDLGRIGLALLCGRPMVRGLASHPDLHPSAPVLSKTPVADRRGLGGGVFRGRGPRPPRPYAGRTQSRTRAAGGRPSLPFFPPNHSPPKRVAGAQGGLRRRSSRGGSGPLSGRGGGAGSGVPGRAAHVVHAALFCQLRPHLGVGSRGG